MQVNDLKMLQTQAQRQANDKVPEIFHASQGSISNTWRILRTEDILTDLQLQETLNPYDRTALCDLNE